MSSDDGMGKEEKRIERDELRGLAAELYRQRRAREKDLPGLAGLWGDHAWDMMLDLFVATEDGRRLDVTSVCLGACVPPTTGIRLIERLVRVGMIRRDLDPLDRRKSMLTMTSEARADLSRHLESVLRGFPGWRRCDEAAMVTGE